MSHGDITHCCINPSSRAVLTNKRNFFTGLRFEVEQASRGLSAIAELLVYVTVLLLVYFRDQFVAPKIRHSQPIKRAKSAARPKLLQIEPSYV